MKKTRKQFEKYIARVVDKYQKILLLQNHSISVKCDGGDAYFTCLHAYPYLNEVITYNNKAFKDWVSGVNMKEFIVHEVCHALTDPLYNKALKRYIAPDEVEHERERLTDHICNIVLHLT